MPDKSYILEMQSVSLGYGNIDIISDINLKVKAGEMVFLTSTIGGGKSTLLKALYADIPLRSGFANLSGFQLEKLPEKKVPFLRRKLGIVFQDIKLLTDRNVYENLKTVLQATSNKSVSEIERRIDEVLALVNQGDKKMSMPSKLSGGEQQSIAIARALLNNPPLILADEPSGNLDPQSAEAIMAIFQSIIKKGTAVIMATHNFSLIKKFPGRLLKIENKKLTEVIS